MVRQLLGRFKGPAAALAAGEAGGGARPGWPPLDVLAQDAVDFLSQPVVAASLTAFALVLALAPAKVRQFGQEFFGTIVMILATFSPYPFFNHHGDYEVWAAHMFGVILADYVCGGPEVNPGVSVAKFVWRKLSLLDVLVNVSAQMAGGVLAFPLLQTIASPYGVTIGGAECADDVPLFEAMWSEGMAMFLLMMGIFLFATTHIGNFYYLKQPLIAMVIRYAINRYGKTGPSINPMGASTWLFYKSGGVWPTDVRHFLIYWLACFVGGITAVLLWSKATGTGLFEDVEAKAKALEQTDDANACLASAWGRHVMALREKDIAKLLSTYGDDAVLLESARGAKAKKAAKENVARVTEYTGKGQIRKALEMLVEELSNMSALDTGVFLKMDGNSKSVFFKWECPSSGLLHVTESLVFNDQFQIICHHRSVERRSGPVSQASASKHKTND